MLKHLTKLLRAKFGFTQKEVIGMSVLIPLIIIILFIPKAYKYTIRYLYPPNFEADSLALVAWKRELQQLELATATKEPIATTIIRTSFDPNTLDEAGFVKRGFSPKVSQRIINYRAKGGRFKKSSDLLKIYGINQALAEAYLNYIDIPKTTESAKATYNKDAPTKKVSSFKKPEPIENVDLNSANDTSFQTIRGVGKYWSGRIIKYRKALGGFVRPTQLKEIYGIDQALADSIIAHSELTNSNITRLSINTDSVKNLSKHPYISYNTAKAIIQYKKQHGDYQSINEIQKIISIPDSIYLKISPYLTTK